MEPQETTICPVTGLPVIQKPHWKDIKISDNLIITFRIIGDQIVHVTPCGHFTKNDLENTHLIQQQIINEFGTQQLKIVEINDFKNVTGGPVRSGNISGTRYFKKKSNNYLASIAFNVPLKLKLFLNVVLHIRKDSYPFEIHNNYKESILRALHIIEESNSKEFWNPSNFISHSDWKYQSDNLYAEFKVLNKKVMYGVQKGYLNKQDVEPVTQLVYNVFSSGCLVNTSPYFISDFSGVTGASWYGRVKFLIAFKGLRSTFGPPKAFIMITGDRTVNIAMKMAQKKMGVTILFVKDLQDALFEVQRLETLSTLTTENNANDIKGDITFNSLKKYEDEIMDFIGSITWDIPGKHLKRIEDDHPFKSIFDALSLIKLDVDELLLESKNARDEAEFANNAKSHFLANISHEIRTPLNGILGMTDLLLKSPISRQQMDNLNDIKYSGEALMDIINEVLDFSKIEAGKVELDLKAFSLRQLVERVQLMLNIKAKERKLNLVSQVANNVPDSLTGDAVKIRQILINLIGNALKFTNQGAVNLEIIKTKETKQSVNLSFTVTDTGVGIPQDKIPFIFDEFSQVDNSTIRQYHGTGLGLAIAQRLVHLMDGDIHVESTLGKGSRFFFEIPLEKAEITQIHPPPKPSISNKTITKLKVLLVEDNLINRKLVERWLKLKGWEVVLAQNGAECLEKFHQYSIDVILMDIQMPEMDGYEATKKIREIEKQTGKHVPIIALTAHALESYKNKSYASGMDDFLTKPIDPEKMYQTILHVISNTL